ncbi:MAG: hypothetical protein WAT93_03455 [Pontixanthobacter sp.]
MSFKLAFNHLGMLAVALCLGGLAIIGEYAWLRLQPVDAYFHYDTMRITSAPASGPLEFISAVQYFKSVDMHWRDTLYCDLLDGNGFRNVSVLESSANSVGPTQGDGPRERAWTYTAIVPSRPAVCYLRSTPTAELRYGIRKTQIIVTDTFRLAT